MSKEESLPIGGYAEKAYLEYSMYVILDRALPFVGDGLKPVQRRIIYAMSELGLKSSAKFKKSARTVGDVIGKFHPHGDSAAYEAMVLMAQNFSTRYPLIEGQGNFGSLDDPKSFAAMRYTECRLSAYSQNLLTEISQGTVDWMPNFDGTLIEPKFLPARLPNVLLNGASGIAVGMATDIPPHNLTDVVKATIALLESPKMSIKELMKYIPSPDFPTKAKIISTPDEIEEIYTTGRGSIKLRATYDVENGEIVISSLPYQVSSSKILEQVASQIESKKISMIEDLRDESDENNPVRLIVVPRSNRIDKDALMSHLFATTELQKNVRVNFNAIGLNGKPRVLISQGTVDWMPNFDGTLIEPKFLPARLPNVLLNGASGIAVGMATDIPPHNLTDVVKATIALLESPKMSIKELMKYIPSPDFPTKAKIISTPDEIEEIYTTGRGSIKLRATYDVENGEIVISSLPYQVSSSKILEQVASQIESKKISMIEDLRDESDENNPVRLIVVPRSNRIDKDALMSHLFATTELQKNVRVNFNAIGLNGKPRVFDLKDILKEWIKFRTETVKRRLQHRLDWVNDRLHILEGLLKAYLNLDEVIKIIRTHDDPKKSLMKKFKLSELQANAILDIRLRQLAKLEEEAILEEKKLLASEAKDIEKILNSSSRLKTLIKKELNEDLEEYGDERNSNIVEVEEAKAFDEKDLISNDPMTVVLSKRGWIRAAKGHDIDPQSLQYREGDEYLSSSMARNSQNAVIIDSFGKAFTLPIHKLPSARGQGDPVSGSINSQSGSTFAGVVAGTDDDYCLLASTSGYGFIAKIAELQTKNKSGKTALNTKGAIPLGPEKVITINDSYLAAITEEGKMLLIESSDLPILSKGKGNKIINIDKKQFEAKENKLIFLKSLVKGSSLKIYSGKQNYTIKSKDLENFVGTRGRKGNFLPKGYRRVDAVEIIVEE